MPETGEGTQIAKKQEYQFVTKLVKLLRFSWKVLNLVRKL